MNKPINLDHIFLANNVDLHPWTNNVDLNAWENNVEVDQTYPFG